MPTHNMRARRTASAAALAAVALCAGYAVTDYLARLHAAGPSSRADGNTDGRQQQNQLLLHLQQALLGDVAAPLPLPPPGATDDDGAADLRIPRIIHQNFLGGQQALERASKGGRTHFRREWRLSCQTHNPHWKHVLWDRRSALHLLRSRYPWFVATWLNMSTIVLQSDALRPFILHAYGGVYLDLDTECFRSIDASLAGQDLVLQAETPIYMNNAQMAGVAGHPFFWRVIQRIKANAAAGITDPLVATGPQVITAAFRELSGRYSGTLPGRFVNLGASGGAAKAAALWLSGGNSNDSNRSTATIYGPRRWFQPCNWDDAQCHASVSLHAILLRLHPHELQRRAGLMVERTAPLADWLGAPAAGGWREAEAAEGGVGADEAGGGAANDTVGAGGAPAQLPLPATLGELDVVGMHHFSGSWLRTDGTKAERSRDLAAEGVALYIDNATTFVEAPPPPVCGLCSRCSSGTINTSADGPGGNGTNSCLLLVVRPADMWVFWGRAQRRQERRRLGATAAARLYGSSGGSGRCRPAHDSNRSDASSSSSNSSSSNGDNFLGQCATLASPGEVVRLYEAAGCAVRTLFFDGSNAEGLGVELLLATSGAAAAADVDLLLDCGALAAASSNATFGGGGGGGGAELGSAESDIALDCWALAWQLYSNYGSLTRTVLQKVRAVLLLSLPPLPRIRRLELYGLYELLYQLHGFVGFVQCRSEPPGPNDDAGEQMLLRGGLALGLVKRKLGGPLICCE